MKPGKSLRFALLPEGQDPDDLYRSGGREAIAEVLGGARPLGEMLWSRETEAASLDTPERRAAFEAARARGGAQRSAMNRCANTTRRISRRGCAS